MKPEGILQCTLPDVVGICMPRRVLTLVLEPVTPGVVGIWGGRVETDAKSALRGRAGEASGMVGCVAGRDVEVVTGAGLTR